MEDFILQSVGANFKKWGCCTPIFLAHSPNFQNRDYLFILILKKGNSLTKGQGQSATSDRLLAAAGCSNQTLCKFFYSYCPPFFAHVANSCWLALAHARLA
jgi:hypothetical protein